MELRVPAMVHVSTSCNPAFHTTGAHYLNADTTAFMQLLQGDLFADFPELQLVIPHGGGAVPYHWGRFRGLAQATETTLSTALSGSLSGVAGIGHILLGTSMIALLILIRRSAIRVNE